MIRQAVAMGAVPMGGQVGAVSAVPVGRWVLERRVGNDGMTRDKGVVGASKGSRKDLCGPLGSSDKEHFAALKGLRKGFRDPLALSDKERRESRIGGGRIFLEDSAPAAAKGS